MCLILDTEIRRQEDVKAGYLYWTCKYCSVVIVRDPNE